LPNNKVWALPSPAFNHVNKAYDTEDTSSE
jgi:hypothetical protein